MRIEAGVVRGQAISFQFQGRQIAAYEGETVAAALHASGVLVLRHSVGKRTSRGAYCFMGSCQQCLVEVDGRRVEACLEPVRDGMVVTLDP